MTTTQRAVVISVLLGMTPWLSEAAERIDAEPLRKLSRLLCNDLDFGRSGGFDRPLDRVIEDRFLEHLGIDRSVRRYRKKIETFWNRNSTSLVCRVNSAYTTQMPQHFLKRVVDLKLDGSIFDDFLFANEEEMMIDPNAIEWVDGRRETLIDYLNLVLSDPANSSKYNFPHLKNLRDVLIEDFGGKTAQEVLEAN